MIECQRCGEEFDPDREPTVPGVDTSRCPACGAPAELEESDDQEEPERTDGDEDGVPCPRCDERLPSRDHLADHLTDEGAFSDVVAGAVDAAGEVEDVSVDVEVTVTRGA